MDLVINKDLLQTLKKVLSNPEGSYLISGAPDSGKFYTLSILASKLVNPEHIVVIEPPKNSIGIEQIQQLRRALHLKTAESKRRLVIVRDGDKMTLPAQNAFLKTLEEPPADTSIYITTANRNNLLPTILSRVKEILYLAPSASQIERYLVGERSISKTTAKQVVTLSNQRIGLAVTLAADPNQMQKALDIQGAVREVLHGESSLYAKLMLINNQSELVEPATILEELISNLRLQVRQGAKSGNIGLVANSNRKIQQYLQLLRYLEANGNAKLAINQIILTT